VAGDFGDMNSLIAEPADAPNPAKALRFAVGCHRRGVGDPGRSALPRHALGFSFFVLLGGELVAEDSVAAQER
jgi:hypothetical protein